MERRFSLTLEQNKQVFNPMLKRVTAESRFQQIPSYQALSSNTSIPDHSSKTEESNLTEEQLLIT